MSRESDPPHMTFGYVRVSTIDQNPDHQVDALVAAGVPLSLIFVDKASGARMARPAFTDLRRQLRRGDTVVITQLWRIGRTTSQLIKLMNAWHEKGIHLRSLSESIDTTTPSGRLWFVVMAALGEYQREVINEAAAAGRASAKRRGRRTGRPPKLTPEQVAHARQLLSQEPLPGMPPATLDTVAAWFGVHRTTLSSALRRPRDQTSVA